MAQTTSINDIASGSNSPTDIIITSTNASPVYIRTPQTITIKFNTVTNVLNTVGMYLYLLLPGPYGEWINRGQVLSLTNCQLVADNAVGNKLSACSFISKRVLRMTLSASTAHNLHTLTLTNIYSPSKVPAGRYNQYRFKLFTSSAAS